MPNRTMWLAFWVCVGRLAFSGVVCAQQASPEDATIDAMRALASIHTADQRRIMGWVQTQVDRLAEAAADAREPEDPNRGTNAQNAAFRHFRERFRQQFNHPRNSDAFRVQLLAQTAHIAAEEFGEPDLDDTVAWGLARALVEMGGPESLPGLIAGLRSKAHTARFICARGLRKQREHIGRDKDKLGNLIRAVQEAGLVETSPVVLSHLYRALAYPAHALEVFPVYLSLMDKTLAYRRGSGVVATGAEVEAFEFFRTPRVLNGLNSDQKAQLVQRLALFLRLDAQRYNTPVLEFDEMVNLELSMDAVEAILTVLVAGKSAAIAGELHKGGHQRRAEILQQVYSWVGNPETKEAGALNSAPWNVAVGAP